MTTHPALQYAEQTLGVHSVYGDANAMLDKLNQQLSTKDQCVDSLRVLDSQIEMLEMELLIAERGKAPDISQAALDRRIKEVYYRHGPLQELRIKRNGKASELSGINLDISHTEASLKVLTARINQLGGYLNYLAAVKNNQVSGDKT